MFAQLFVLACACALGFAQPPYVDYQKAIDEVIAELQDNVLSIDGDIPHLNDPRRHYTQVLNVIIEGGEDRSGCLVPDYDSHYPEIVNASLAQGLANTQDVVTEISDFIEEISNITHEIIDIVQDGVKNGGEHANQLISEKITLAGNLKEQNEVYLSVGEAAEALVKINPFLLEASENYATTTFAVEDKENVLKDVIEKTAQVYRQLKSRQGINVCN
uniref:Uncharacterized protein n=1 Tax=Heliothis virescens TaxID=7102 RepID=A0A2A4JW21_HELVI